MSRQSQANSRASRSPPTTDPTPCSRVPGEDLEQIVARFGDEGIRCTWLETSHAFHSELLDPVLDEFESYAAQLEFAVPTLPLVCNRTGAVLTAQTPLDAQYWRRHSRQPVQFAESVRTVAALGCSVLMEIGPQPVLTGAAVQVWPEHLAAPRAIVSLRKGVGDRRQIAEALAAAYVGGHRPDFAALHRQPRRKLELPTYPFQRRRFWPKTSGIAVDGGARPVSGILGSAKDLASGDSVYTSRLSVKSQPWLSDHVIYGTVVVPGATYAAMALAAVGAPARVEGRLLLRADHPAREEFSRGAADPASARRAAAVQRFTGAQPTLR